MKKLCLMIVSVIMALPVYASEDVIDLINDSTSDMEINYQLCKRVDANNYNVRCGESVRDKILAKNKITIKVPKATLKWRELSYEYSGTIKLLAVKNLHASSRNNGDGYFYQSEILSMDSFVLNDYGTDNIYIQRVTG